MPPVPAHLAKYAGQLGNASQFAVASRVRFPYISIGDNRFTAIDAEGNETILGLKSFEFLVVAGNPSTSKIFYKSGYNPESPSAPDCYSDNGLFPDIRVVRPEHSDCSNCMNNVWGSAKSNLSGKDIKACGDYKKLAVIPFDAENNELGVHMLRLSPASNPKWAEYLKELAKTKITSELGLTPQFVVNRAYWSDKKNVMAFEMVDFLDENELEYIKGVFEGGDFESWIGTDQQSQARPQLASSPRHVTQAIAAPSKVDESVVDAEFSEEPKTLPRGRMRASEKPAQADAGSVQQPRKRAGSSQFLDEQQDGVPGRARAEALEGGKAQGQRVSAVDAMKARAREQIANGNGRR